MDLGNEDTISEYTESVFSMPAVQEMKGHGKAPLRGGSKVSVSDHFSPRYVGREAVEERSGEGSSEGAGDVGGVPPPIAVGHNGGDSRVIQAILVTPLASETAGTDVFNDHKALIDEDITTSLEAYGIGGSGLAGMTMAGSQKDEDNLSLSSTETYGYSLDGMNSTVATSTKYGY